MSETKTTDIPPGYSVMDGRGAFTTHNGPIYRYDDGDVWKRAFLVLPRHCNSFGLVHGGWFMSFADGLLAEAVSRAAKAPMLTVRLTSDFLSIARPGDFVEGTARATRVTRSMGFAEGELRVGGKLIFTASGVFKLMEGHAARAARPRLDTKPEA